jgi:hypothetical protein
MTTTERMNLPYTTEDYKKYVFTLAQRRIWRIHEIIDGLALDDENEADLHYQLDDLMGYMQQSAFVSAEQHVTEAKRRRAEAEARRAEYLSRPPLMEAERQELRERLQDRTVDAPRDSAPAPEPPEPFDPDAFRAYLGMDHVGFIGVDHEEQIGQVEHLAERIGAEVIIFRGIGLDDQIVGRLMANMVTSDDFPDQWVTLTSVNWPTQTQLRIMDELIKMPADDGNNFVHEERIARRLVISVEEVRHHLKVLADIGLAEEDER